MAQVNIRITDSNSELYPSMELYLEKTENVLVKAGVSRVKIHIAHDIILEESVMAAGKCPRSGDIQQGIVTALSASLTRLVEKLGLVLWLINQPKNRFFL